MHEIFVSYSRKDRELALPLLSALERQGFSVWWDFQLKTGEVFDSVIEAALNEARCCLVLWSRHSIFADWVRAEATKARERGILLPVLLEEVPIPAPFNILQTANFTTWSGILPFPEFDRLVASIKSILTTGRVGDVMHAPLGRQETAVPLCSDHLLATDAQLGPNRPLPYPPARPGVLRLRDVLYPNGQARVDRIEKSGRIVFHAVGDTGNINGTREREAVVQALLNDFEEDATNRPIFLFHLGDLVCNFGEAERYYDQFYDPFRNYPAPIFAIPGHHDGMVSGERDHNLTLSAFLLNFCSTHPSRVQIAGDVDRPTQIQPGVYWTLTAPFIRILALYSNCLGGAGIISSQGGKYSEVGDVQISFLKSALTRIKKENYSGAVIVAVHHPPYCAAGQTVGRGDSRNLLRDLDDVCQTTGVWPHAVLSAHSDNYQRFTRFTQTGETPYIITGNGGHGLVRLAGKSGIRTPVAYVSKTDAHRSEKVTFERYDHDSYGYIRVRVTTARLQIEYVRTSGEIFDSVAVDLTTRKLVPSMVPLL